ncbi:ketopantoate reductase family protein [Dactylosporangium darangshiense]|uniref:ketopantoate reductase family protein n=1 Tax=Dactylosporangium darangshiense TaxID=579108 RepID=UPI00363405EF
MRAGHRGDEGGTHRRRRRGGRAALGDAGVVSLQNGLGNEEVVAGVLPRVMRGTIVTAGTVTEPGVVRYDAPGDSWIGPFEPAPARAGRSRCSPGC